MKKLVPCLLAILFGALCAVFISCDPEVKADPQPPYRVGDWLWKPYADEKENDGKGNSEITLKKETVNGETVFAVSGLIKNGFQYGFAGLTAEPATDAAREQLKTAKAVSFWISGDKRSTHFKMPQDNLRNPLDGGTSDASYYETMIQAGNAQGAIQYTIKVEDLAQPSWGAAAERKPFDQENVFQIDWQTEGGATKDGTPFEFKVWGLTLIMDDVDPGDNTPVENKTESDVLGSKDALSEKTAAQYFADQKLYLGWNAGNSLDAPTETAWGNVALSQTLFNGIKAAGFTMIRVPITWVNASRPIGASPDYELNQARLDRVVQVVDMAFNADLAVVINVHHDGSGTSNWLSVSKAAADENVYTQTTAQYTKVWEQIADRFKAYGDWLIFESFNELHNGTWGWGDIPDREYEVINEWNQAFTDTVRAAGGNNTGRFLVIQPYCAKPHQALADTFVLPTDTVAGKQIVSMHYYDPESFALNGSVIAWDTGDNKAKLIQTFADFKTKFTSKGIPVIIGECGATYHGNRSGAELATANANRLAYLTFMTGEAKKNGLVPVLWDNGTIGGGTGNGEKFGLFARGTGEPISTEADAIIKAMVNAVK